MIRADIALPALSLALPGTTGVTPGNHEALPAQTGDDPGYYIAGRATVEPRWMPGKTPVNSGRVPKDDDGAAVDLGRAPAKPG
jgi:hypothetical protein